MRLCAIFWAPRTAGLALVCLAGCSSDAARTPPRLVVLVHVDSLRADYLERFLPLLGEGGFRRFMREGTYHPAARVTHTVSLRASGVTALATGCLPGRAGIPSSRWFDRARRKSVGAVDDEHAIVRRSDPAIMRSAVSPRSLERSTLGDLMQAHFGEASVVVSISWYAESALLLGGRESDASLWLDPYTGTWVSSSQVVHQLPAFAVEENEAGALHKYRGEVWERSFTDEVGQQFASPDDDPDEPPYSGMPHFPYEIPEYVRGLNKVHKVADGTPFNDRTVLDLVLRALPAMELGADGTPDLLCIDFSSVGDVGADYGPDSQELMDTLLRLDRRLEELMVALDAEVGAGRWTLALASTEGMAQLPEKTGGVRLRSQQLQVPVELGLRSRYPQHVVRTSASWTLGLGGPWLYLSHDVAEAAGVDLEEVRAAAAELVAEVPGIESAWTPEQLRASEDPVLQRWADDLHPTRSGDVLLLFEPGTVLNVGVGTGPGSHHAYDRVVPLLLTGQGVRAQQLEGAADPLDVMPTLAAILGLPMPDDIDGQVLPGTTAGR
jgi:predicted AlkP superfamily pyrophosphatase or phosphodiesterase